jgi:uncharacterized membrane protein
MVSANAPDAATADEIFRAELRPQRSLGRRGFAAMLAGLAVLSLAIGGAFFALGAWPVPGFLGLDVLALFVAFRLNYRASRRREEISLTRDRLTVRRTDVDGRSRAIAINPYWARLEIERRPPFGIARMAIASHGRSLPIGAFLGPGERETLAAALSAALAEARAAAAP